MEQITSKDNPKIKHLRKLGQKKYRREFGEFLVENEKIILDAAESGDFPTSLFVVEEKVKESTLDKINTDEAYLINESINKSFSALDTPPGIAAVYQKPDRPVQFDSSIIYLNGVSDPGNLGTILRTTLAFGFENIILDEECVDPYNPKTIQAAKDAIFKINISFDNDLELLQKIKKEMPIISTRLEDSKNIDQLKKHDKLCIVFGSESTGISKEVEDLSDEFVRIDMTDKIESLNVASSAAIILHELHRKNK